MQIQPIGLKWNTGQKWRENITFSSSRRWNRKTWMAWIIWKIKITIKNELLTCLDIKQARFSQYEQNIHMNGFYVELILNLDVIAIWRRGITVQAGAAISLRVRDPLAPSSREESATFISHSLYQTVQSGKHEQNNFAGRVQRFVTAVWQRPFI